MNKLLLIIGLPRLYPTILCIFCALILFDNNCLAQNKNEVSVDVGFLQLKDELNQGMVYHGPQIGFHYHRSWFLKKWELLYKPGIAVGVPYNRGMIAANINFKPIDFSGIKSVYQKNNHDFRFGLSFATNYSYQVYPEQHSAQLFWYGEIGIAPCIEYSYQWNQRKIKVSLQNSIAGFVSRTEEVSPYFYSFKFLDFFTQPNQNMRFGSFDKYNHTNISIEYIPNISKKHSFAVGMDYIDSYFNAHFQSLNYYLQWKKSF